MDLQNPDDPDTEHSLGRGVTKSPVNDRLPFMRFLGLVRSEWEPDAKRWLFRERLTWVGAIERLFERFNPTLRNGWCSANVRPDPGRSAGVRTTTA